MDDMNLVYLEKFRGYLNKSKYLKFLNNLKKLYPNEKINLFHDGLSVHKTKLVTDHIDKNLKWMRILNVAYTSDDNPIETVSGRLKQIYRKKLLEKKI